MRLVILPTSRDYKPTMLPDIAEVTKLVSAQRRLTVVSERDDPDFSKDMLQAKGPLP